MKYFPIAQIKIGERQRTEIAPKQLQELKDSISEHGLIHAPVLTAAGVIVAGERRLRAMTQLHEEGIPFTYDNQPVPVDHIPYTDLGEADDATMAEVEFAENIMRVDLSWQDRTAALKRLFDHRKRLDPSVTVMDLAREVNSIDPLKKIRTTREEIAQAQIVAEHLDDPEVKRARSAPEAYKIILDRVESRVLAQAQTVASASHKDHRLIQGDCRVEMKKLPSNLVDTIICDPPYGMKADKMGKGEYHMYDDSPEAALDVCRFIIQEGFRVAKPKAILFMFCDIDHFVTLRTFAGQQAWSCWRAPIIWRKGTDGHSPWGRAGFVRTYECCLFAVKGQRELLYPGGPDVLDCKRPGRGERVHSAEKPVELLRRLIKLSALPGQTVLDPTAGSGPIIEAATLEKVKAIIIEKEESYFNECVKRLNREPKESTVVLEDGEIPFEGGVSTASILED